MFLGLEFGWINNLVLNKAGGAVLKKQQNLKNWLLTVKTAYIRHQERANKDKKRVALRLKKVAHFVKKETGERKP